LDESLERLRKGEKLESWAEEEIEPLLEVASRMEEISTPPREAFVEDLERRLVEKARALQRARRRSLWDRFLIPIFSPGRARRWAAVLAVILALVLASAGTAIAAQGSMPGDPLYPVKRVTERLGLLVVRDLPGKTHLRLEFTRRRAEEIEALYDRGQDVEEGILVELAAETEETLEEIEVAPEGNRERLFEKLVDLTERQQEVLQRVYDRVPEQAKPALLRALEVSRRGHERATEAIQQGRPEVPPGQEKEEHPGPPEDRGKGRDRH
ncbi:MAG: DUF5667 domain-containing protein, partial [Anaerolineae bacterium]|nr:DUF5667 domain-containing protein [Anaerolineae bacterium]